MVLLQVWFEIDSLTATLGAGAASFSGTTLGGCRSSPVGWNIALSCCSAALLGAMSSSMWGGLLGLSKAATEHLLQQLPLHSQLILACGFDGKELDCIRDPLGMTLGYVGLVAAVMFLCWPQVPSHNTMRIHELRWPGFSCMTTLMSGGASGVLL